MPKISSAAPVLIHYKGYTFKVPRKSFENASAIKKAAVNMVTEAFPSLFKSYQIMKSGGKRMTGADAEIKRVQDMLEKRSSKFGDIFGR